MKLSFFCHTASTNAIGRAYSLWLLAEELGWRSRIHVPDANLIWPPLKDEQHFRSVLTTSLDDEVASADVLVAVKPLLPSFGTALSVKAITGRPLVLDVDDPDWEQMFGFQFLRAMTSGIVRTVQGRPVLPTDAQRARRRNHMAAFHEFRLRRRANEASAIMVSNPALKKWYPGEVIPHVRHAVPVTRSEVRSTGLRVAFVGTPRPHKGLGVLRSAIRTVDGAQLIITADTPHDAHPCEEWVGKTTLQEGLRLVNEADVVALPSMDSPYARYQLPVKLIDAMMAGRAVVASDLPPLRWAADGAALFVPPGDVGSLARALTELRDGALRERLADRGRVAALGRFTPRAVASVFADLIEGAYRETRRGTR